MYAAEQIDIRSEVALQRPEIGRRQSPHRPMPVLRHQRLHRPHRPRVHLAQPIGEIEQLEGRLDPDRVRVALVSGCGLEHRQPGGKEGFSAAQHF